jgi:dipeptidyl aminopeptidase/acylaminoacyl peptidase
MRKHLFVLASVASLASFGVFACGEEAPPPAAPTPPVASAAPAPAPVATAPAAPPPPHADASLPPRSLFFSNPDHTRVQISDDGKHVLWLAPVSGVLNIWAAPTSDLTKAVAVTQEKKRDIRSASWARDSAHVLFENDTGGDENFHVFAVDLVGGAPKDLTPVDGARADIVATSPRFPGAVLVQMNDRDKKLMDVYRVDLKTGARKLVLKNEQGFAGYAVDDDLKVRVAVKQTADGGSDMMVPGAKAGDWTTWSHVPMEDSLTTGVAGFDATGKTMYVLDSRDRDTAALFAYDTATKKTKLLAEDPRADVSDVIVDPKTEVPQAVISTYDRDKWTVLDKAIEPDLAYLKTVNDGDLAITSRSRDDSKWIVAFSKGDDPGHYYLYDRKAKKAQLLFPKYSSLEGKTLSKENPVVLDARDGTKLVSYLWLPPGSDKQTPGKPDHALPMVLFVHGGPWARDSYGYSSTPQWLASRGYAVLQVNYRGSTGLGKKFINAGNGEWAGKMHDDLIDAVSWAIDQRIADPTKVAIMGGSYGGYATLVGVTFTPEVFACGVDIVGPSNLNTLLSTIPPYWAPMFEQFAKRVGDPRTDDGKKLLDTRSPLTHADKIVRPLLIGQGANDPRVKQAEADQIVKAMQQKNIPVTYVLFPDEGHGFARQPNRTAFNAVAETFLAQCIGGSYQPIGDDFAGSSITVPTGADHIQDLGAALSAKK